MIAIVALAALLSNALPNGPCSDVIALDDNRLMLMLQDLFASELSPTHAAHAIGDTLAQARLYIAVTRAPIARRRAILRLQPNSTAAKRFMTLAHAAIRTERGQAILGDCHKLVDKARPSLAQAHAHSGSAHAPRNGLDLAPRASGVRPASPLPRFIVFTRASKEAPYLRFFVEWYVGLGFDRIVVLVQTKTQRGLYLETANHPSVQLIWADKQTPPDALLRMHQELVLGINPEAWVLQVDIDELLLIDEPSIGAFVDARARHHSCELSALGFRWVAVQHMDPTCESLTPAAAAAAVAQYGDGLGGVAGSSQTFSGPSYYPKYMAKAKAVQVFAHPHVPTLRKLREGVHCVDLDGVRLHGVHTLRRDTAKPWLVPLTNGSRPYAHAALLHLETRSLSNMLVKALTTRMPTRVARSKDALASLLIGARSGAPTGGALMRALASAVGTKLFIPLFRVSQAAILERDMAIGAAASGAAAARVGAHDAEHAPGVAALAQPSADLAQQLERLLLISGGERRHSCVCEPDREASSLHAILDRHGVSMEDATSTMRALAPEIGRLMRSTHAVVTSDMFKRGGSIASCLTPWNKQLDWAHDLTEGEIECLWRVLMPAP
jgi:hypothetical protein